MAILKHVSHKGSDYNAPLDYYIFKHNEDQYGHYKLILDDGRKTRRKNCRTYAISAKGKVIDPEVWVTECQATNLAFGKNKGYNDIKNHEFIISFPAQDRQKLTFEKMWSIAQQFVLTYCRGHSALISIHRDTDNDHIHITINSVRARARPPEPWMVKSDTTGEVLNCECMAGGKYQDSDSLERHRNDWLLAACKQFNLTLEDNNKVADERKAIRRRAKSEYLRNACKACAQEALDAEDLRNLLLNRYGIMLRARGKTISLQYAGAQSPVRLEKLGMTADDLCCNFLDFDPRETIYRLGDLLAVPRALTEDTYQEFQQAFRNHEIMLRYWQEYQDSVDAFEKWCAKANQASWDEFQKRLEHLKRTMAHKKPRISMEPERQMDPFEILFVFFACPVLGFMLMACEGAQEDAWKQTLLWEREYQWELEKIREEYEEKQETLKEPTKMSRDKTLSLEERIALLRKLVFLCGRHYKKIAKRLQEEEKTRKAQKQAAKEEKKDTSDRRIRQDISLYNPCNSMISVLFWVQSGLR